MAHSPLPANIRALPLPERIKAARKAAGITSQEALGELLGTYRVHVNAWETGRHAPSEKYAEKLALVLGGEPADWLDDDKGAKRRAEAAFVDAALELARAGAEVAETVGELRPLLVQQEALVVEMRTLVAQLARLLAAK